MSAAYTDSREKCREALDGFRSWGSSRRRLAHWAKSTTGWLKSTSVSRSKERNSLPFPVFNLIAGLGDLMKTKFSKTLLTAVLTSAMALGTGASLGAQDQSMDKPSAGVSVQVDQGAPPPTQTVPQYNAPDQSGPQDVAPPSRQDQDTYQDQAQAPPPPTGADQRQYTP